MFPTSATKFPTHVPTSGPHETPSITPTSQPSKEPTRTPTFNPTNFPSDFPSYVPSGEPSRNPTCEPTYIPTRNPTSTPSNVPIDPTCEPTLIPTSTPSDFSTLDPTVMPSKTPTATPVANPTLDPVQSTCVATQMCIGCRCLGSPSDFIQPETSTTVDVCADFASSLGAKYFTFRDLGTSTRCQVPDQEALERCVEDTVTGIGEHIAVFRADCVPTISPTREPTKMPSVCPSFSPTVSPTEVPTPFPTCVNPTPLSLCDNCRCDFDSTSVTTYRGYTEEMCQEQAQMDGEVYFAHREDDNRCQIPVDAESQCIDERLTNTDRPWKVYEVICTERNVFSL